MSARTWAPSPQDGGLPPHPGGGHTGQRKAATPPHHPPLVCATIRLSSYGLFSSITRNPTPRVIVFSGKESLSAAFRLATWITVPTAVPTAGCGARVLTTALSIGSTVRTACSFGRLATNQPFRGSGHPSSPRNARAAAPPRGLIESRRKQAQRGRVSAQSHTANTWDRALSDFQAPAFNTAAWLPRRPGLHPPLVSVLSCTPAPHLPPAAASEVPHPVPGQHPPASALSPMSPFPGKPARPGPGAASTSSCPGLNSGWLLAHGTDALRFPRPFFPRDTSPRRADRLLPFSFPEH